MTHRELEPHQYISSLWFILPRRLPQRSGHSQRKTLLLHSAFHVNLERAAEAERTAKAQAAALELAKGGNGFGETGRGERGTSMGGTLCEQEIGGKTGYDDKCAGESKAIAHTYRCLFAVVLLGSSYDSLGKIFVRTKLPMQSTHASVSCLVL
jgi:hypothetical protein